MVPGPWKRVVFAHAVGPFDECPQCGEDYTECPCPGPTMDGWEYRWHEGYLQAREENVDA